MLQTVVRSVLLLCVLCIPASTTYSPDVVRFRKLLAWIEAESMYDIVEAHKQGELEIECLLRRRAMSHCVLDETLKVRIKRVLEKIPNDPWAHVRSFKTYDRCSNKVTLEWVSVSASVLIIELKTMCTDTRKQIVDKLKRLPLTQLRTTIGIILNVMDNPGGMVVAARNVSRLFLQDNNTPSCIRFLADPELFWYVPNDNMCVLHLKPLIGFVNKGTGSAAEILMWELLHHDRFEETIGEPTFAKTVFQRLLSVRDVGVLYVTAGTTQYDNGMSYHDVSFHPSIQPGVVEIDSIMGLAKNILLNIAQKEAVNKM